MTDDFVFRVITVAESVVLPIVEDELQAVGVGITEADYDTQAESYTVETNLRSPAGETVSVTADGFTYTQAVVPVPWNFRWGTWHASSNHWGITNNVF